MWLLDVDGVVNAKRPGWGSARRQSVWSAEDAVSYPLRWAPELVDRIRSLHEQGAVEVRWCTTWCTEAHLLEALWRLPRLVRAIDAYPMPRGPDCWALKLAAARGVLAEGRRLVWTDDEVIEVYEEEAARLSADGRALLIATNPTRGLRPADLRRITEFLAAEPGA